MCILEKILVYTKKKFPYVQDAAYTICHALVIICYLLIIQKALERNPWTKQIRHKQKSIDAT